MRVRLGAALHDEPVGARGESDIEAAIDEIGGELHSQYMISYSPKSRAEDGNDFGYHQIAVSLVSERGKGLKVSSRPGYYIAPPGS